MGGRLAKRNSRLFSRSISEFYLIWGGTARATQPNRGGARAPQMCTLPQTCGMSNGEFSFLDSPNTRPMNVFLLFFWEDSIFPTSPINDFFSLQFRKSNEKKTLNGRCAPPHQGRGHRPLHTESWMYRLSSTKSWTIYFVAQKNWHAKPFMLY